MTPRLARWSSLFVASLASSTALSQTSIVTDGSLGSRVTLNGSDVQIDSDLGQIRRANLFHSFEQFDIGTGDRATFTGPAGVEQVISRVTGNFPSSINGTLASTVGSADVWLVNPAGVIFGPNAGLDVPAGFHVSTADSIQFSNGDVFSAANPDSSALSVAAPQAFGFLDRPRGSLQLIDGVIAVRDEQRLSLVGGEVAIQNATADAPDGTLTVVAKSTPGRVLIGDGSVAGTLSGTLRVTGTATLRTDGDRGGTLRLRGDEISIEDDAVLQASRTGDTAAAGLIDISSSSLTLAGNASISADSDGNGPGGAITLRGGTLQIDGNVTSDATANGDAGEITLDANDLILTGRIFSENLGGGTGNAGNVRITSTGDLSLTAGAVIGTNTQGGGNAGTVVLSAPTMTVNGTISSDTAAGSTGNAGVIDVSAGTLTLNGQILSESVAGAYGDAGSVLITASEMIQVGEAGQIGTNTEGGGAAGLVSLSAPRMVVDGRISSDSGEYSTGDAGFILLNSGEDGALLLGGNISSTTAGSGDGGGIQIDAGSIYIDRQIDAVAGMIDPDRSGQIRSNTRGSGDAGTILINAVETGIYGYVSSSALPGSTGAAGAIVITAPAEGRIDIGGTVFSNTSGSGDGGLIAIDAGTLNVTSRFEPGVGDAVDGTVRSDTDATGDAGIVLLSANLMTIDGEVTSDTTADGDAGFIDITAQNLDLRGRIFSENLGGGYTTPSGAGGNVSVVAMGRVTIAETAQIGTGTDGSGGAGTVFLQAGELQLEGQVSSDARDGSTGPAGAVTLRSGGKIVVVSEGLISSNTAGTGDAGIVSAFAERLELTDGGAIRSDSTAAIDPGAAGDVVIRADQLIVRESAIATTGADAAGGRIDIAADQAVRLSNSTITTSGALPAAGASLLSLKAPFIEILNKSRVLSLAGGETVPDATTTSGAASVDGVITLISDDSVIAASNSIVVQGLDSQVGSGLQVTQAVPIDVDQLLSGACSSLGREQTRSSFVQNRARSALSRAPTSGLASGSMRVAKANAC